ncbi:hypothetical protein BC830DRAFT_475800 [Chytriomyces sp. MP71]|nr:hypothetical protein BC830DRAFT_475800 [Chytriomyces sp. MP71]
MHGWRKLERRRLHRKESREQCDRAQIIDLFFYTARTHRNESNHLFPPDNAPPSPQHHNEVDNVNDFAMDENNDADDGRRKGGGRGTGRGAARGRGSRGNAKASRNNAAKPTRDTTASRRNRSSAASRGRNRLAPDLPLDPHDFPAPVALPPQPQPARILPLPTYPDDEFTFSEDEEAFRALAQLDPSSAPVPRAYNSDDAFNYLPDTAFDDLPVLMDRPPPPSRQPRAELVDLSGASPTPTPRASDLRTPPQHQRKGRKTDEFDFSSSPFAGSSHVPLAAVSRAGTASGDSLPVSGGTADEVVLLCQITKARGRSTVEEITMSPPRRIVTALIEDGTDVVRCVVKETLYPGWNDLSKLARWKESAMQCEWKMVLEWEAAEPVIVDMTAL